LLPLLNLLFVEGNILGDQHVVDLELVVFQDFEIFVSHLQSVNIRVLVLNQLKLNILPELDNNVQGLLHLQLLLGLVGDFFNSVLEVFKSFLLIRNIYN
jgi:hypothetical protein